MGGESASFNRIQLRGPPGGVRHTGGGEGGRPRAGTGLPGEGGAGAIPGGSTCRIPRFSGSVLFFRQEYAQELSDEEYGRYNFNWGYCLHSLKRLCETGEGTPHRPGGGDA